MELLPWERNRRKYAERPKCFVDWEWFRVAANKLREQAKSADPNDFAIIEFDGEVLRIKTRVELIAMPAQGTSWDRPVSYQFRNSIFCRKESQNNQFV